MEVTEMAERYRAAKGTRPSLRVLGVKALRIADIEHQQRKTQKYDLLSSTVSADVEKVLRALKDCGQALAWYYQGPAESRVIDLGKVLHSEYDRLGWYAKYAPMPRLEYPTMVTVAPDLIDYARGHSFEALSGLFNAVLHARANGRIYTYERGHDTLLY